ncbi:MAG: ketopantoate reductase family protein [Candidatus Coatesbacteria bacterium]|nr:ketopantoate reductase family protein [Candidatus Coatesbacteria bacterium]
MELFHEPVKIVIIGAGAIGRAIGLLVSSAIETHLVVRSDKYADILNRGWKYTGIKEGFINIKTYAGLQENLDETLIVIASKAYDLEDIVINIKDKLFPSSYVLAIQNGYGIKDILAKHLEGNYFTAIASIGATILKDNVLGYYGGGLRLEENKLSLWLKETGIKASLKVSLVKDIDYEIWRKLVINCTLNPLSVLFEADNKTIAAEELNLLKENLMEEIKLVARLEGYEIATSVGDLNKYVSSDNKTSMLQDYLKGKDSELDFMNGAILKLGEKHGIRLPANKLLYELVKSKFLLSKKQRK